MAASLSFGYGVPIVQAQPAPASTNWTKIYPSLTATFIPALDPGMFFTGIYIRSAAAGGAADGSNFQIAFNQASSPSFGYEVGGVSGADFVGSIAPIWSIWVKMGSGTDLVDFIGLG